MIQFLGTERLRCLKFYERQRLQKKQTMDLTKLTAKEARVLGVLIEKAKTTPDQYPLTLNSLRLGCNQKTSRYPVVDYEDANVRAGLNGLKEKGLVKDAPWSDSRVTKFVHTADTRLGLSERELALVGVLLLRGAQTPGELRSRTDRIFSFAEVSDVLVCLDRLGQRVPPIVSELSPQPGQKERRYITLLCEHSPDQLRDMTAKVDRSREEDERPSHFEERIRILEERVALLESKLIKAE